MTWPKAFVVGCAILAFGGVLIALETREPYSISCIKAGGKPGWFGFCNSK